MNMLNRVKDPKKPYIRRGIGVCPEWETFENFRDWALKSGFRPEFELDRENNDKWYAPDNCRWVSHAENCANRSPSGAQYAVVSDRGERFDSAQEASRYIGHYRSSVSKAIATGYKAAGRHWFRASKILA